MKNIVSKRGIFWMFVIGIFVLTPLFTFLLDQRGYETPDNYEDIWPRKVDAVLYGKENSSGDASSWERLMSYDLLSLSEDMRKRMERKKRKQRLKQRPRGWRIGRPTSPISRLPIPTWG